MTGSNPELYSLDVSFMVTRDRLSPAYKDWQSEDAEDFLHKAVKNWTHESLV